MKKLASLLQNIYLYTTAFIIVASPLFFIPRTSFTPETTYYIVMLSACTLALLAHTLHSFFSKTWHTITHAELASYILFPFSLIFSATFASDTKSILFSNDINYFSALSLFSLFVVVYLVRALPEDFRKKIKKILVYVISVVTFIFLFTFIFSGKVAEGFLYLFSGFTSPLSLALYLGLFVIGSIFFLKKTKLSKRYILPIITTTFLVSALLMSLAGTGDIRPDGESSLRVAKEVFAHQGPFGIGAGNFAKAWQLYRPQAVLNSPYFDVEFSQGSGTITTFLTTIGIVGTSVFLFFVISSIYLTYRAYRKEHEENAKHIALFFTVVQVYFLMASLVMPLSFSILIVWMVSIGLGLARAHTTTKSPNKIMAPVSLVLVVALSILIFQTYKKAEAMFLYSLSQKSFQRGDIVTAKRYLSEALDQYPLDSVYRAQIDVVAHDLRFLNPAQFPDRNLFTQQYISDTNKAITFGILAVKVNPGEYKNYVALGKAYELAFLYDKESAYTKAKRSYQEAIKLYPSNPYLYILLARLDSVGGTKNDVRLHLNEALEKKENFTDALYLLSQLASSEQDNEEALHYALEALKIAPNDPAILVQAGLLFYGKRDYENAVLSLQKALDVDQNNTTIAYFLALALRDGGRTDLAKQIGEELIRRSPGNADVTSFLQSVDPEHGVQASSTDKNHVNLNK